MMVEALCCWRTSEEHGLTVSRIVELIFDDACSHFALGKYSSAEKDKRYDARNFRYSCWPQIPKPREKGERDADVVVDLYTRARDIDDQKGYTLLNKIGAAAGDIP